MIQSSLYVGISGQLALQRRIDTIANNVANSSTAGFRSEEVKFDSLLSNADTEPVAFASTGEQYLSSRVGELVPTGNPLDIAVQGTAWLSVQSPDGPVYTRDGRFQMLPTGDLQTLTGYPVLDGGGAPITLNPAAGPVQISKNGVIQQSGRQVGVIGLFSIDPASTLRRYDTSGVVPDRPAEPVVDFSKTGVVQGFIERSNVNPIIQMTNLIAVSRAFDGLTAALAENDSRLRDVIQTMGGGSR